MHYLQCGMVPWLNFEDSAVRNQIRFKIYLLKLVINLIPGIFDKLNSYQLKEEVRLNILNIQ